MKQRVIYTFDITVKSRHPSYFTMSLDEFLKEFPSLIQALANSNEEVSVSIVKKVLDEEEEKV